MDEQEAIMRKDASALIEARRKLKDEYDRNQRDIAQAYHDKQVELAKKWRSEQDAKADESEAPKMTTPTSRTE